MKRIIFPLLATFLSLTNCRTTYILETSIYKGSEDSTRKVKEEPLEVEAYSDSILSEKQNKEFERSNFYNDISLVLSGRINPKEGRFDRITNSNVFVRYNKRVTSNFSRFETKQLGNFKAWSFTELSDRIEQTDNLFYPFSGPDLIYAYSMIPTAKNYFLFGLEPVGEIPNIENARISSLDSLFNSMHKAISDNLNLSFFITRNMKEDLSNEQIKGTIPILLFFMTQMNLHIQDIQPVSISKVGEITYSDNKSFTGINKKFREGVEISFLRENENSINHVYYFSVDLSNYNHYFEQKIGNLTLSLNNVTTLVKSSSYCMHDSKKYSGIRDLILDCSDAIIQDDTSIPFRFFNKKTWNIQSYGSYVAPISVFAKFKQDDLKSEIKESAKPIDFRFGYNYPSNILVFRKKKIDMSKFKDIERINKLIKILSQKEDSLINIQNEMLITENNIVKLREELNDWGKKIGIRRINKVIKKIEKKERLKNKENILKDYIENKQKVIYNEERKLSILNNNIETLEKEIKRLRNQIDIIGKKPEYESGKDYLEEYYK